MFLERISAKNWRVCVELGLAEGQERFVPSNLYSIAEAQFYGEAMPLAICDGNGKAVGFTMYGFDHGNCRWRIFRLMVDRRHQGRGFGRAAMEEVIERLAAKPDCKEILVAFRPDNLAARSLYESLGFIERDVEDGKVLAGLRV